MIGEGRLDPPVRDQPDERDRNVDRVRDPLVDEGGNVRSPDACFVAKGRFPGEKIPDDYPELPPDLAVEVVSPADRPRQVLDKVGEYLEAGVRLVWVIDPAARRATSYRSISEVREVGAEDDLDGEDVLPGFRCRLSQILD